MPSFWNVGAIFFSLLAGLSQANLLDDTHMLKRYTQAVEVPPAATHFPSTILPGNGSAVGTSTRVLLPTSTRQLIDATTLHSLHSQRVPAHPTGSISVSSSEGGGTSVTSIEVDWTGLLPVTPSVSQSFRGTTHQPTGEDPAATEPSTGTTSDPDTSFDDGSGRATEPSTTDISLHPTSVTLSDNRWAHPRTHHHHYKQDDLGLVNLRTRLHQYPRCYEDHSAAVNNDGGGQCGIGDGLSKKGLREACDRAINKYEDDTVYSDYVSRYSRESAKENDGIIICGHIRLSNSCTIIMDYCTNCKTRG
ncbi:hypothetical protein RAB80_014877 [Fusarium oxysporum f. sp. vasinfectum]|nr:hypothetical protein RAB80_014877 [Fusarium oxysporum f. sp. vasinfectum]